MAAGLFGMMVPVALYLAVNAGGAGADGWGVAMSTDTALALGLLVMVGRDVPDRVRTFLLTVFVVDDIVALLVIAVMYTDHVEVGYLLLALVLFAAPSGGEALRLGPATVFVAGVASGSRMLASGVDPVVTGLAIGLTARAYTPARGDLEEASGLFRQFREEPTPDLARTAAVGLTRTLSPNDRLQRFYHPWTSYVIVPLFALANAGVVIDASFLRRAVTSPITLGIVLGYVVGKPVAVVSASWAIAAPDARPPPAGRRLGVRRRQRHDRRHRVHRLVPDRHPGLRRRPAGRGEDRRPGRGRDRVGGDLGRLPDHRPAADRPSYRGALRPGRAARRPRRRRRPRPRPRPRTGGRDRHRRRVRRLPVPLLRPGRAGRPRPSSATSDVRFVWRHLPLPDVHPQAELAAQASEAAAEQGKFWEMHDLLLDRQDHLMKTDLLAYAEELGLDVPRFGKELYKHVHAGRVGQDVESADISGVSGTPTFFVNGRRHYGAFDVASLTQAIATARDRARIRSS